MQSIKLRNYFSNQLIINTIKLAFYININNNKWRCYNNENLKVCLHKRNAYMLERKNGHWFWMVRRLIKKRRLIN